MLKFKGKDAAMGITIIRKTVKQHHENKLPCLETHEVIAAIGTIGLLVMEKLVVVHRIVARLRNQFSGIGGAVIGNSDHETSSWMNFLKSVKREIELREVIFLGRSSG